VIGAIKEAAAQTVDSCIIDSEAVGWDPEAKRLLPFQMLSLRARKGVALADIKIRVCIFAFDVLFLNGRSLLGEPLRRRRELLHEHFREIEGRFVFATFKNISASEGESAAIQPFLEEAVAHQCEGLMVKALDSQSEYLPNQRSFNWLKIKKDYMDGMTDSIDLVPIAAWYGTGKRTGWFGGYLLACYDEESESFQAMTKVATGLSEADLEQHHAFLSKHIIPAPKSYYTLASSMKAPDVWLDAVQVWEVKGADMTISPAYTAAAGQVDPSRGISLRFPRFLRVRDDKHPEQATTSEQLAELYKKQTNCIAPNHRRRHND
jgi:DNA ligase-1